MPALDARHPSERIFMYAARMLASSLGSHKLINSSFLSSRHIMRGVASELRRTPLPETVRKESEQRTNHEFGQYAEHEIGQEEPSQQPMGFILRVCPRPSNHFLEDDLS